ncbi:MAG: membrane protein insertion efficiency factor YidD [Actinomycetota bacterium]
MRFVRRFLWGAGAPVRLALLGAIALYRVMLSGWMGGQCRFSPTCSRYAEEAIRSHGAVRGVLLAGYRVLRCNPFGRGGLDPVPSRHVYDAATHFPSMREPRRAG